MAKKKRDPVEAESRKEPAKPPTEEDEHLLITLIGMIEQDEEWEFNLPRNLKARVDELRAIVGLDTNQPRRSRADVELRASLGLETNSSPCAYSIPELVGIFYAVRVYRKNAHAKRVREKRAAERAQEAADRIERATMPASDERGPLQSPDASSGTDCPETVTLAEARIMVPRDRRPSKDTIKRRIKEAGLKTKGKRKSADLYDKAEVRLALRHLLIPE
jgi:hypothetical protein